MGLSVYARAWRAGIIACGLAWFGPVDLRAETPEPSAPPPEQRSAEPFGLAASFLTSGGLHDKWLGVQRRLDDELVQLALCDGDRDGCVSPAALQFLAIVDAARAREGRARFGEINRAINLAVRMMSDLVQYGEIDVWTSPLVTFTRGAGDCEDYAIAKFVALRLAGVSPAHLRIVIVYDAVRGEDHAVAAAKLDGRWLTLDNRRMAMIEDIDAGNDRPIFVLDHDGVRRYEAAPLLARLPERGPAPIVALNTAVQAGAILPAN